MFDYFNSFFKKDLKFDAQFVKNYDTKYHTIEIIIGDENLQLLFNIDVYKAKPQETICELEAFCGYLRNSKGTSGYEFTSDRYCFFRPEFEINQNASQIVFKTPEKYYNRGQERFKVVYPISIVEKIISDFEKIIKQLG